MTSTTEPGVGSITYDAHGNTTSIWGEERTYDATDRHIGTIKRSAEVSYRRDPGGRVIERSATGDSTERLGYLDGTDGTDFTQDADGALIERYIALPGGALLTKRADGQIWSLPNVHGDTAVTTDASGVVLGQARTYDALGAVTGSPLADNSAGTFDYGWLGEKQRPTEHTAGLAATIEMGARQYDPVLGRFLQVDPVEGGSANDYDYVNGDPVNDFDLTGTCGFGNPFKKCGRGHEGRCLFGKQGRGCRWGKTWRAAHRGKRWAHRHFTVSMSGCAIACLGVAYHHGHLGLVGGHGCCSAGIYGGYVKRWRTYRSSRHGSLCAGYYATACWQHRRRRQFVHEGHGLSLGFGGGYSYTRTRWN